MWGREVYFTRYDSMKSRPIYVVPLSPETLKPLQFYVKLRVCEVVSV